MSDLDAGTVVEDRYIIRAEIGRGGLAVVYACEHRQLGHELALKILSTEWLGEEAVEARFLLEARIMARLEHPNVASVFDYGFHDERPYMVMRLLRGQSLAQRLTARGPMDEEDALALMIGALEGLEVAHRRGIVHKDIKPENLFLSKTGEHEALVITDFGVARNTEEGEEALTAVNTISGTPQYLAPEYVRHQIVTPALDVYQMALVLVEMLTGNAVVQGDTPYACLMLHARGQLDIPAYIKESELGDIIARGVAYDHTTRFRNAGEFALELERYVLTRKGTDPVTRIAERPNTRVFKAQPVARIEPVAPSSPEITELPLRELRGLVEGQKRVLVVDDDEMMRELIGAVLESVDVETTFAGNGSEGLMRAFAEQPDLILVDQMMPHTTGIEMISQLRKHVATQHIPAIMLTGQKSLDMRVAGLRTGADDYITKPFQPADLIARVGAVLRRTQTDRNVDPLTKLPGNLAVSSELSQRLQGVDGFVFAVAILRDFDSYVGHYAFEATFKAVRQVSQLVYNTVLELGQPNDFMGTLASNRFAMVLNPARAQDIGVRIIERFEEVSPAFYTATDRDKGYITLEESFWKRKRAPLMSLAIALLHVDPRRFNSELDFARYAQQCLDNFLAKPAEGRNRLESFSN